MKKQGKIHYWILCQSLFWRYLYYLYCRIKRCNIIILQLKTALYKRGSGHHRKFGMYFRYRTWWYRYFHRCKCSSLFQHRSSYLCTDSRMGGNSGHNYPFYRFRCTDRFYCYKIPCRILHVYTGNPDRRTWTAELYASAELHRSTKRNQLCNIFCIYNYSADCSDRDRMVCI